MKKVEILKKATDLISGDRAVSYGDFHTQMTDVSGMWSILTGRAMQPREAALFLMCLKLKRMTTAQDQDSEVDMCGYAALFAEFYKYSPEELAQQEDDD